jgi:adenine C2-methylase RlmN of 23S rRNA A2503 and tRNA A37
LLVSEDDIETARGSWTATVRLTRGRDIAAACGQLAAST